MALSQCVHQLTLDLSRPTGLDPDPESDFDRSLSERARPMSSPFEPASSTLSKLDLLSPQLSPGQRHPLGAHFNAAREVLSSAVTPFLCLPPSASLPLPPSLYLPRSTSFPLAHLRTDICIHTHSHLRPSASTTSVVDPAFQVRVLTSPSISFPSLPCCFHSSRPMKLGGSRVC